MQGPDFSQRREAALRELAGRREILSNAYVEGFQQGQEAAEAARPHPPALLQAAKNWRHMILAQLQVQSQEEKTLQAREHEEKARRVALAMRAAETSEPAAWNAWKKLGMEAYEKHAEAKVALAVRAEQSLEQKHGNEMQLAAMHQEEKSEPRAWQKWDKEPNAARKQALIMTAEENSEPAAYKSWEQKRAAEARVAAMHAAMQKGFSERLEQMDSAKQQAMAEASKLFQFCSSEFPESAELRQFCFEKLSSPASGHAVDSSAPAEEPRAETFSAPTLQDAILKAQEHGEEGVPEYAVFHPRDGPAEAFKLLPVEPGSRVPEDSVGFVNVNIPQESSLASMRAERAEQQHNEAIEEQRALLRQRVMIKERENMLAASRRHEDVAVNGPTLQVR
jgi:hypothetical protein